MRVGDMVKWTSQAGGFRKTKVGVIVCVVPSGVNITRAYPEIRASSSAWGGGLSRGHESYIVKVKTKLYWPLVKNLKIVELNPQETPEEKQTRWPSWMTA